MAKVFETDLLLEIIARAVSFAVAYEKLAELD
jgi:hypothetical protein